MFKKYALAAVVSACTLLSYSQNVGIGVQHPGSMLSVKGGISIGDTYAEKNAPAGSILIEKSMGIGTDTIDPNVVLDIRSATKGVLFPTMSTSTIQGLTNPPKGLMVFNSDSAGFNFFNGNSWINFALLGPNGPIGAAATLLGGLTGSGSNEAYAATANTVLPVSIGTGTKIFTVHTGLSYRANDRVRVSNTASKYMEGTVTAYLAGVLTVNVDRTIGSGSYTSWSIGLAGDVGATGATGAQGIQGPAGANGTNGTNGAAGAVGPQGPAGVAGVAGAQGLKGNTGATGATGVAGINGTNGTNGAAGAVGPQGPQGVAGANGTNGVTGATGAQGIQGPQGVAGANGTNGAAGAVGPQGPAGVAGAAGAQGIQGLKGNTGNTGATGVTGANGTNGTNGTNGAVGPQGPQGVAGANGTNGAAGAVGPQGPAGAQGPQGAAGVAGAVGAQGLKGNTGATGVTGAAGNNGTNGTNGTNGAVGPTGASTQWSSGNGNIGNGQGNVGDWYLRTSSGDVYEKTASNTWTLRLNMMGPTGPTGSGGSGWSLSGNAASNGNFIGTTNNIPLLLKVNNTTAGYIASSDNNTFLGYNPNYGGSGSGNVGIGATCKVYGNTYSVAIGYGADIQTSSSTAGNIAIGYDADVSGTSAYSIAIGSNSQSQGANAIVLGRGANTNQSYAIAMGDGAQVQGSTGIAIGKSANTNSADAVVIGTSAQVQGTSGIGIGKTVYVSGTSAIAIGDYARAQAANAIAIGTNIYNGNANTVSIGNSSVTSVNFSGATTTSQAFMVGTNSTNGNGAYLTKGGTWTNASDRELKEEITKVNAADILNKIAALDITKWKYKGTDEYHIGPMAQDFYAAFSLGGDDKRISTIDPSGVALVAIQALNQKVDEQQKMIDELKKQLMEMKEK